MPLSPFKLERYFAKYEFKAGYFFLEEYYAS